MFVGSGDLLFGDAAERRGITEPQRLVREFKRRVGDDVPLIIADRRFRPEEVFALMVGWVVDTVTVREGRLPSAIAVTVPAAWGTYRRRLVADALSHQGWSSVTLVTEPEAAARHYVSTNALPVGKALAVYDLGGGTFDAIVLKRQPNGDIDMVGAPTGIEDVGGADFDDAMVRHAITTGGVDATQLAEDGDQRVALAAFRRECIDAKEALSFDSEAVVPLLIGAGHGTVRVTRGEFEQMIEEQIARTADVLDEAISASGVPLKHIDAVLLTGGSSRIPRVAQLLSERFNRPIAIDADPKAIIALGAVRILSDRAGVVVVPPAAAAEAAAAETAALEAAAAAEAKGLSPVEASAAAAQTEVEGAAATGAIARIGAFAKRHRRGQAVTLMSAGTVVLAIALVIPATGTSGDDGGPFTPSALRDALSIPSARAGALFGDEPASASAQGAPGAPAAASGSGGAASRTSSGSSGSSSKSSRSSAPVRPGGPAGSTATPSSAGILNTAPPPTQPGSDPTPSGTPSSSDPTPSDTPSSTPSDTPTSTPTDTPSDTPSPTPTVDPTPSDSPSPTTDPTPADTPSPTDSPTDSSSPAPTE